MTHLLLVKHQKTRGVCELTLAFMYTIDSFACQNDSGGRSQAPSPVSDFTPFPHLHRDALNMKTFFSFKREIKIWESSPLAQMGMNTFLTS